MKEYKKARRTVDYISKVQCNRCAEDVYTENYPDWLEYITIKHHFGYFSKHDFKTLEFDLCSDCLVLITKRFKIPPKWTITGEI